MRLGDAARRSPLPKCNNTCEVKEVMNREAGPSVSPKRSQSTPFVAEEGCRVRSAQIPYITHMKANRFKPGGNHELPDSHPGK